MLATPTVRAARPVRATDPRIRSARATRVFPATVASTPIAGPSAPARHRRRSRAGAGKLGLLRGPRLLLPYAERPMHQRQRLRCRPGLRLFRVEWRLGMSRVRDPPVALAPDRRWYPWLRAGDHVGNAPPRLLAAGKYSVRIAREHPDAGHIVVIPVANLTTKGSTLVMSPRW